MASCAATMTGMAASSLSLKRSRAVQASAAPQVSFSGLRRGTKVDSIAMSRSSSFASQTAIAKSAAKVTCDGANTSLIITLSTGALLAMGRFVFLPFQRDNVSRQGLPEQNGTTHYEAGDSRAQEAVSFLKTNDPAGFTLVDVLAWGALGHAIGFFILATASNGYNPQF
ncbi:hypothetical protein KC19_7G127800 [Ceratodon purpureus]|uniref:Photosystem I reaction center subunit V, chloroplastic n=1 Tax=Ceratodon purpureus TaxID=3225 RepID=A0A8T0H916_CERPU|nr:hypothetical protein KC19_7G127800 [Ceratodon purpureus]